MKKFALKSPALALLLITILFSAPAVPAASAEPVGTISAVEGRVDLLKSGNSEFFDVKSGVSVSAGDTLRTKSGSKAEIAFMDKTIVRLSDSTLLEIKDYVIDPNGNRSGANLFLGRGKIRAVVSRSGNGNFLVTTPNALGSVKGTDIVAVYQRSSTSLAVLDGKLSAANVSAPGDTVDIKSGQSSIISGESEPTAPRALLSMEIKAHESDTNVPKATAVAASPAQERMSAEGYNAPGAMKAVVIKLAGSVKIKNRGSITWHDAKMNEVLTAGDTIETKDKGKIEIRLENGNVVTLQQNSNLILEKLSSDNKTGDYENLLESKSGKLRAQVQKIKGNSKFEIKTPNAVACVRGTIMYLNILPNLTNSYFEEGNGVLRSLISNTVKDVPLGTGASADNAGNVSDPTPPNDNQMSEWHQGWDVSDSGEGYSSPSGDLGQDRGSDEGDDTGFQNKVFDEKPVTEIINTTEENGDGDQGAGEEETPEIDYYITGTATGSFGFVEAYDNNSFDAYLSSETVLSSAWSGSFNLSVDGEFSSPGYRIFEGDVSAESIDGGAAFGWVGGIFHSWEGILSTIYIDPSGRAGTLFGYLSGTNTINEGQEWYYGDFSGNGDIYVIPMAQLETGVEYPVEYGGGYGNLWLSFGENGGFNVDFDRQMARIVGQNWGIWRDAYYGGYYNPEGLAEWFGNAGGYYGDDGYFFATAEGIDDLDGGLRIDIIGTYLDTHTLGAYYGSILAETYAEGMVEGVGLGGYAEEPLAFSGNWGSDGWGLYYDCGECCLTWAGEKYGLIGSPTVEWWNEASFPVVAMGESYCYDYRNTPLLWVTPIGSYNADNEDYTSLDGSAFWGISTGIWKDGLMSNGKVVAFYVTPEGTVGLLKGDLSGVYDPEICMWMAEGELSPEAKDSSLIDPASLYESITEYRLHNLCMGGSVGGSALYGYTTYGVSYAIDDGSWGIYEFDGGGYYNGGEWAQTNENGLAFGYMDGLYDEVVFLTSNNALFDDDNITGALRGSYINISDGYIGTLNGNIVGIYDEDSWILSSIGEWEMRDLSYAGVASEGGFGYFDGEGAYLENGGLYAAMGSADDLFSGPSEFTLIGGFYYPDSNEDGISDDNLWGGDFYMTASDGAGLIGAVGGTTLNNKLSGALLGIYIRYTEDGYRAGYVTSSDISGGRSFLTGDFYPSIGMFGTEGYLTAFLDMPTSFTPEDLLSENEEALLGDEFYDPVHGDLKGDLYGDDLQIADQDWGIWRAGCGGWFDSAPDGNWNSYIAESFEDQYGEYSFPYYSLIYIDGTTTADNGLEAVIHGYDLGMTYLSEASGLMAGDYDADEMSWEGLSMGTWVEKELTLSGLGYGGVRAAGDWDNWFDPGDSYEDFSGEFSGIIGSTQTGWQDGSFKAVAMGDYAINGSADSYLFNAQIGSFNAREISSLTLDEEGAFYGFVHAAVGDSSDGRLTDTASGLRLAAIYIASDGTGGYNAGVLRGGLDMDLVEIPDDGEVGMWIAEGYLTPYVMETDIDISPEELSDYISWDWDVLGASGVGSFSNGGAIQADYFTGDTMSIEGYDQWGIMQAALTGQTSSAVDSDWRLALGGASYTDDSHEIADGYFLISASGDSWSNNVFDGTFKGVYFSEIDENTFNVGKIEGDVVGNYQEVEGVDTVFQAQMLGEWVDLVELSTDVLGFDNEALAEMVQVPITETYTALLQNAGINGSLDISIYNNEILTGLIQFTLADLPMVGSTIDFNAGSDNLGLTFTNIDTVAMTWTADALGQINNMQATGGGGGSITAAENVYNFDGVIGAVVTPIQ